MKKIMIALIALFIGACSTAPDTNTNENEGSVLARAIQEAVKYVVNMPASTRASITEGTIEGFTKYEATEVIKSEGSPDFEFAQVLFLDNTTNPTVVREAFAYTYNGNLQLSETETLSFDNELMLQQSMEITLAEPSTIGAWKIYTTTLRRGKEFFNDPETSIKTTTETPSDFKTSVKPFYGFKANGEKLDVVIIPTIPLPTTEAELNEKIENGSYLKTTFTKS